MGSNLQLAVTNNGASQSFTFIREKIVGAPVLTTTDGTVEKVLDYKAMQRSDMEDAKDMANYAAESVGVIAKLLAIAAMETVSGVVCTVRAGIDVVSAGYMGIRAAIEGQK